MSEAKRILKDLEDLAKYRAKEIDRHSDEMQKIERVKELLIEEAREDLERTKNGEKDDE